MRCLCVAGMTALLLVDSSSAIENPLSLSGEFRSRLVYSLREGFVGRGGVRVTLSMRAGLEGNPRLIISMPSTIARTNQEIDGDFQDDIFAPSAAVRFGINAARLEAEGPLWRNGPSARVRMGRFYVHYSDWIARSLGRTGIELRGLPIGIHNLRIYYGLPAKWLGIRIDGGVNEQFGRIVTLQRPGVPGGPYETDAHLYYRLGSARGSHSAVQVVLDGGSGTAAGQIDVVWRRANRRLQFSLWSADKNFAPPKARRNRAGETVAFTAGETGMSIDAEVPVGSFGLGTQIRLFKSVDEPHASSTQRIFVSHSGAVHSRLELSHDPYDDERSPFVLTFARTHGEHGPRYDMKLGWDQRFSGFDLAAERDVVLYDQPVTIRGVVSGDPAGVASKFAMTWEAPNGLQMGIHYATHDSKVFGLEDIDWHPAGLFVTAEAQVSF